MDMDAGMGMDTGIRDAWAWHGGSLVRGRPRARGARQVHGDARAAALFPSPLRLV